MYSISRLEINGPLFRFLKIPIILFSLSTIIGIAGAVMKAQKASSADSVIVTALWLFAIALGWAIILLLSAGGKNQQ